MSKIKQITKNDILRKKAKKADPTSKETIQTVNKMKKVLKEKEDGLALAAPQLGIALRIVVIAEYNNHDKNISIPNLVMINPQIIDHSQDKAILEEGCLSVAKPEIRGEVDRFKSIKVSYYDLKGNKNKLTAEGLLARIIQHELDHLNGIIFIDRANPNSLYQVAEKTKSSNSNEK